LFDSTPSNKSEVTLNLSTKSNFVSNIGTNMSLELNTSIELLYSSDGSSTRSRANVN
jgi:hypothetical protein